MRFDNDTIDDRSNSKTIKFDASKRHMDERLNKVIDQFSRNRSSYERDDDYDDGEVRRHGRKGDKYSSPSKNKNPTGARKEPYYQNQADGDDDDDDDIVALMDRMNRK